MYRLMIMNLVIMMRTGTLMSTRAPLINVLSAPVLTIQENKRYVTLLAYIHTGRKTSACVSCVRGGFTLRKLWSVTNPWPMIQVYRIDVSNVARDSIPPLLYKVMSGFMDTPHSNVLCVRRRSNPCSG
uniref:Secreted protein n=1 Tax=Cacopsylla melanoneura TaxID=428564 RepID=A0A8D8SLB8_9HEMI